MESDFVNIGSVNGQIMQKTTTGTTFTNIHNGKNQKGQLPPFAAANIRGTHFSIGPGGPTRPSEF